MPRRLTLAASSGNAFSCVCSPRFTIWRTPRGMNVRKLLFGRLTGRRDPVVKSLPVVDCLRVGHQTPLTAETRAEDDPRPGSFTSSGFQKAKLLERRDAIVETDLFRDLAILDTEYGCPGEPHLAT